MNFISYLLKAKGRHGTHSPYIYKFVEDALHESEKDRAYPSAIKGNRKEHTFFRVLSYLRDGVQKMAVSPPLLRTYSWLKDFTPIVATPGQMPGMEQILLVLSLEEMELCKQQFLAAEINSNTVILLLHPGNAHYALLPGYFDQERFNCTVFAWDFSILMNRADFNRKQHFVLR